MQMQRVETKAGTAICGGAVENGLFHFLALRQVALDVLDLDGGIIHQDSDREGEASQGHDVDGLTQRAQQDDRHEDRKRDRDEMTMVGRQSPRKSRIMAAVSRAAVSRLEHHAANGGAYEEGLIEERSDLHFRRKRLRADLSHALDAFDDGDGGGAADLQHGHQGAANAVHAHDVGLRRETIADVGHIAHVDGRAIDRLDRKIIQFRDGLRIAVHLDLVFQRTDLGRARRAGSGSAR